MKITIEASEKELKKILPELKNRQKRGLILIEEITEEEPKKRGRKPKSE